jgi:glutamate-1-semialdehyde 2,1-aminomutase
MQTLFFSAEPVTDYASAKGADTACYGAFHGAMLDRGVYFAPSQFEAAIVSLAHGDEDIEATISAAEVVLQSISAT